jgi:hypothetical protein
MEEGDEIHMSNANPMFARKHSDDQHSADETKLRKQEEVIKQQKDLLDAKKRSDSKNAIRGDEAEDSIKKKKKKKLKKKNSKQLATAENEERLEGMV